MGNAELMTNRNLGSHSRPRTPPPPSHRPSQTPPQDRQNFQSPERRPYTGYTSSALGESWDVVGGGDPDDDDDLVYEDDEDEFGLPSITSMRRKRSKKKQTLKVDQISYPSLSQTTSAP